MDSQQDDLTRLREQISQAVADQLLRDSPIDWAALTQLDKPVLRIHFSLQDEAPHRGNHPAHRRRTPSIASVSTDSLLIRTHR